MDLDTYTWLMNLAMQGSPKLGIPEGAGMALVARQILKKERRSQKRGKRRG